MSSVVNRTTRRPPKDRSTPLREVGAGAGRGTTQNFGGEKRVELIPFESAAAGAGTRGLVPNARLCAADVNHFPDGTEVVVVVNLKQILNSEAVKSQPDALDELKEALGQFAGVSAVQKYLKVAGLDAFRDLQSITYAYTGSKSPKVSFLVLEGKFSAEKLNDAAKAGGTEFRATKAGDHPVYEIAPRGAKRFYATLLNPSMLIAADTEEALADARSRTTGAQKSALKKEVRKWLESADDKQSVAFVTTGAAFARLLEGASVPNAETAVAFLQTLDAFSGGFTLAKGIQFRLTFSAESEEVAKKLTESANSGLRILLTLVQQNAEKDAKYRPVVDVVKGLRFTSAGTEILFRGEVSLDTVEKLMKNFPAGLPKDQK
jgi:hypothetical protein